MILSELTPSLNLISQTNGSGIGSGKIIKGKILEGLTTAPTTTASATTTTAPVPALTPSTTTTQASPQVKAVSQERIDSLKNHISQLRMFLIMDNSDI